MEQKIFGVCICVLPQSDLVTAGNNTVHITFTATLHNLQPFFVQLVYKVKLDFVLEQLASASVGGYGQDVWSELVEEARTNLMKITVSASMSFL